MAAEFNDTYLG